MPVPDKIRVDYPALGYGGLSGRLADGRFFLVYMTGAAPAGQAAVDRWIAVRHLFDADGNHLDPVSRVGGYCRDVDTFREDRDRAQEQTEIELARFVAGLVLLKFEVCPVDVRLFGVLLDDVEYGFFHQPPDTVGPDVDCVIHMPRDHWYYEPWNSGEYDT